MFTVAVRGSYPKQPDPPRPFLLGRAIKKWRTGLIEIEELERFFQRSMVETAVEMVAAGAEVIWDGQIRWDGPADYMFRLLRGFSVQPDRVLGTRRVRANESSEACETECDDEPAGGNGHQPEISAPHVKANAESKVEWVRPLIVDDFRFLNERSPVPLRPTLTGPYSLARLCDAGSYRDRIRDLTLDLAKALNRELIGLQAAGAKYALIEEPLLFGMSEDSGQFLDALGILCGNVEITVFVACGGGISGLETVIARSPIGGVCLDLTESSGIDQAALFHAEVPEKLIEMGLVGGRSRRQDDEEFILKSLIEFADRIDPDKIWISPTCGLGGLPRDTAFEKIQLLYRIAERARRELGRQEGYPGANPER